MNRKILLIIFVFLIILFSTGCAYCQEKEDEEESIDILEIVIDHFDKNFNVGKKSLKAFEMVGAVEGFGLFVDEEEIEIYLYDPTSDKPLTQKNIKKAKTEGTMVVEGFENFPPFPVIYNENINVALFGYDEHSNGNEIVKVFKSITLEKK
jgi:hypothetical protein